MLWTALAILAGLAIFGWFCNWTSAKLLGLPRY